MEANLWLAAIVVVLLGLLLSFRITAHSPQSSVTLSTEQCAQCRYSLVGLPQDAVCPECGCKSPRLRLEATRYQISLRENGLPGVPIMAAIFIISALFYPVTWQLFHPQADPLCPIGFDRLDDEPTQVSLIVFLCCAGGYLVSLLATRRRWLTSVSVLALGAGVGSHIGLSIAASDHYGWHRVLIQPMMIGGLTGAVLGEGLLVTGYRFRRRRRRRSEPTDT